VSLNIGCNYANVVPCSFLGCTPHLTHCDDNGPCSNDNNFSIGLLISLSMSPHSCDYNDFEVEVANIVHLLDGD